MAEDKLEVLFHRNAEDLRVEDISSLYDIEPSTVRTGDPIWKMVAALIVRPRGRNVYVLDTEEKLIGTISFRDMIRITNARLGARRKGVVGLIQYLRDIFREDVDDLMRDPIVVNPYTNLVEALQKMEELKMNDMPIVDDDYKLVGELSGMEILRFAYEDIKRGDKRAAEAKEALRSQEE